jgi:hypothetical protein
MSFDKERAFRLTQELRATIQDHLSKLSIDDVIHIASILEIDLEAEVEILTKMYLADADPVSSAIKFKQEHKCNHKISSYITSVFAECFIRKAHKQHCKDCKNCKKDNDA